MAPDSPDMPPHDDAERKREDLARLAADNADAVWGSDDQQSSASIRNIGWISGDVGAKGEISGRMRALSAQSRRQGREVPSGSVVPGTGRYILGGMLLLALGVAALLALLFWLVAA